MTPHRILGSHAFQIDPGDPLFCHNSYFIVTIDILNVLKLKGVPKEIWSMFFEAGVKNQNFKLKLIELKFCMGLQGPNTNFFHFLDHIDLGPYLKVMANFKETSA